MNRIPKEFFKAQSGGPRKMRVIDATLPESMPQVNTLLKSIVDNTMESCKDSGVRLAPIVYGLVSAEGFMPKLVRQIADNMGIDESRLGLAAICTMGEMFAKAECDSIKDALTADGLELPSLEWITEHRDKVSFLYTCHSMQKLACDCPACIVFYYGKRSGENDSSVPKVIEEIIALCKTDPKQGNPDCVKHLIPEAEMGKWERTKLEKEDDDEPREY